LNEKERRGWIERRGGSNDCSLEKGLKKRKGYPKVKGPSTKKQDGLYEKTSKKIVEKGDFH